jgi:distribution and morphology protein 31
MVVLGSGSAQKAALSSLARQAWGQRVSCGRRKGPIWISRRDKHTEPGEGPRPPYAEDSPTSQKASKQEPGHEQLEHDRLADSVSKYLHLPSMPHLPKMPHRPTKEELLAAATGFWQRLRVRFKWFSIRSMRPWNIDEWGAFISWLFLGHIVWILVGTTTFFSLLIFTINTVFAQETLAKWVGDYLTQSAGLTVVFESAIVPKWRGGVITFTNVFVSRRPGQTRSSVTKGSSSDAAAEAAVARVSTGADDVDDGNYTQFDMTLNTVNVTLSFIKWWNGKGPLKDVEIKGVRGVVDRTSVDWSGEGKDPADYRREHHPGDFEIDSFRMEDLLVTVHQPSGFRPFPVSIYSCDLPRLRKQWLFHDFLAATHMSGSIDGSLFTIHPRQAQTIGSSEKPVIDASLGDPAAWRHMSRLRIDGLRIDHLNRGDQGPFGWIYEGNVDIVADVMFPADPDESIGKVVSDFYERMEEAVTSNRYFRMLDTDGEKEEGFNGKPRDEDWSSSTPRSERLVLSNSEDEPPSEKRAVEGSPKQEPQTYLVMDVRIHLNDVKAAVPLFNSHISYVNQALVRPIVAYINAKRTYIPISCRIVKRSTDFDGAWSAWDSGLLDDMGAEVYEAFARDVEDQQSRVRRLKRVGLWTLSLAVHALLAGVAGDLL